MPGRKMLCLGVTILSLLIAGVSRAQHGHMHGGGSHHGQGAGAPLGAVGGYPGVYAIPYFATVSPFGGFGYYPVAWMGGFGNAPLGSMLPPPMPIRRPVIATPPPRFVGQEPQGANKPARAPSDPARANQSITVGDRLFRAGNLKKAEERYQQALRAAPDLAAPHLRMRRSPSFGATTRRRRIDSGTPRSPSPAGSKPRPTSSRSTGNLRISPGRLLASNPMSRSIPTTETPG